MLQMDADPSLATIALFGKAVEACRGIEGPMYTVAKLREELGLFGIQYLVDLRILRITVLEHTQPKPQLLIKMKFLCAIKIGIQEIPVGVFKLHLDPAVLGDHSSRRKR